MTKSALEQLNYCVAWFGIINGNGNLIVAAMNAKLWQRLERVENKARKLFSAFLTAEKNEKKNHILIEFLFSFTRRESMPEKNKNKIKAQKGQAKGDQIPRLFAVICVKCSSAVDNYRLIKSKEKEKILRRSLPIFRTQLKNIFQLKVDWKSFIKSKRKIVEENKRPSEYWFPFIRFCHCSLIINPYAKYFYTSRIRSHVSTIMQWRLCASGFSPIHSTILISFNTSGSTTFSIFSSRFGVF